MRMICPIALIILVSPVARAMEGAPPRIDPDGVPGALVIVGGGRIGPDITETFRSLAGDDAKLVVIPTASASADEEPDEEWIELWKERGFDHVKVLHTRDRDRANDTEFVAPIREATAVWFGGGDQSKIAEAYLGTEVESAVFEVLRRGGVVGGTSAGAAIMTKLMITGGNPEASTGEGFDLLPDAVVDQHFLARNRKPRLQGVLAEHPEKVGFGIDESTALVVKGRDLSVVGRSSVTVLLAPTEERPERETELKPGRKLDLTALRRAARDRAAEDPFPPQAMAPSRVENGSLVIVGGGGLPDEVVGRFVSLAGGAEAKIVVVPTASEEDIPRNPGRVPGVAMFRGMGVASVGVLYGRHPEEICTPEQIAMLEDATGIWFGGGRQWRFVDCYEGTEIVDRFHEVLKRGGVIGGSSAGETIQGDYLVRGNPLGNTDMMADGYERGFAFLPGVAIDQHFAQRGRFRDLSTVVDRFPQVLGLGIDEGTALIVEGGIGEVLGKGSVHIFDRTNPPTDGQPDYETIESGGRYDLVARRRVEGAVTVEGH